MITLTNKYVVILDWKGSDSGTIIGEGNTKEEALLKSIDKLERELVSVRRLYHDLSIKS